MLMMLRSVYVCCMALEKKAVKDVDDTIFVKTKRCPPTHGTLELYILRANYQALRYGFKQTMHNISRK